SRPARSRFSKSRFEALRSSMPCGRRSTRPDARCDAGAAAAITGRLMQRHVARYAPLRYAIAVLCVAVTTGLALWLRPFALAGAQLLLLGVLVTGWVSGLPPALLAWVLATLAFDYFFTLPFDAFKLDVAELPRLAVFTALAALLATVSAARRRAED